MPRRVDDWLRQADKDLKHARNALRDGDYEWSCFAAQQAAEKALKALYHSLGGESLGHSTLKMLNDLPLDIKPHKELLKKAANLDKLYIPSRYPNGFDWGAPMDYFGRDDAEKAISDAEDIISYAKSHIFK
ncbi:MAG: HEPN domain-containing protein [Actinomycetota bacterium]|nr:HEPN domain-containing protein [Actinomycetota bacterium]